MVILAFNIKELRNISLPYRMLTSGILAFSSKTHFRIGLSAMKVGYVVWWKIADRL
jgi:hypothetical protein